MTNRVKSLISHLGLSTRAFALTCGLPQNTLCNQLNGNRDLSLATVSAILATFPDLSAEWLLRGKGEMYTSLHHKILPLPDVASRLKEVVNYSKLSVRAFAEKCSLKQQTLDKQIKGISEPSVVTLIAVATTFPEISTEWLLLGMGPVLKETEESDRINGLVDTIAMLQKAIKEKTKTITKLESQLNTK